MSLLIKEKLFPGLLEWSPPQSPMHQCFPPGFSTEWKRQLPYFYVPPNRSTVIIK